jgi:hypothetical protein
MLDLFCGAGGAAMGYHRAGFDVTGVDIKPQKNFPFAFIQGDALDYCGEHGHEYDAIHASPPCQRYANVTRWRGIQEHHPDLIPQTRTELIRAGLPWVIENVPGAPIRPDLILCGSHFALNVIRHRWFETSWRAFSLSPICVHAGALPFEHKAERAYADAMGCEWMTKVEARESIPPAYTAFIGRHVLAHLALTVA